MAVTLKDIAEICGVDISTVSRALRDDPRVQAETRVKLRKQAAELGYVPNLAARNLVSGKTLNLWMIIPDMNQPVVREPAQFLSESLKCQGYDLLLSLYHDDAVDFRHKMSRLSQNVADGAFVIPNSSEGLEEIAVLLKNNFPMVFIDRGLNISRSTTVTTANAASAAELTRKCLAAGADKLVVFFNEGNSAAAARLRGAIEVLSLANIPFVVVDSANDIPSGFMQNGRIAAVASSFGHINQLQGKYYAESGKQQLIAGVFDGWSGLTECFSHIFVCKQNFKQIAEQAARIMLRKINAKKHDYGVIEVPAMPLETLKK